MNRVLPPPWQTLSSRPGSQQGASQNTLGRSGSFLASRKATPAGLQSHAFIFQIFKKASDSQIYFGQNFYSYQDVWHLVDKDEESVLYMKRCFPVNVGELKETGVFLLSTIVTSFLTLLRTWHLGSRGSMKQLFESLLLVHFKDKGFQGIKTHVDRAIRARGACRASRAAAGVTVTQAQPLPATPRLVAGRHPRQVRRLQVGSQAQKFPTLGLRAWRPKLGALATCGANRWPAGLPGRAGAQAGGGSPGGRSRARS